MDKKILFDAVNDIMAVGLVCHSDMHEPQAIYKILEKLVEGVRERAPNTARDEICPHFYSDRVPVGDSDTCFERVSCCRTSGKLSPVA